MSFSQMDENKRSRLRFERSENSNLEVRNLEVRFQISTMQTQIGVLGRTKASVRGEAKEVQVPVRMRDRIQQQNVRRIDFNCQTF